MFLKTKSGFLLLKVPYSIPEYENMPFLQNLYNSISKSTKCLVLKINDQVCVLCVEKYLSALLSSTLFNLSFLNRVALTDSNHSWQQIMKKQMLRMRDPCSLCNTRVLLFKAIFKTQGSFNCFILFTILSKIFSLLLNNLLQILLKSC